MKKNLFTKIVAMLLAMMSLMSIAIPAMASFSTMYVNCPEGQTVRLRSSPSTSASVVINIPYATAVQAEYYNSNWYYVSYGNNTGYMMSSFLTTSLPSGEYGFTPYLGGTGSSDNLRLGQSSTRVANLKRMLSQLGYYSGSITNSFDEATENAVKSFQRAKGLTADGIAGKKTKLKIWVALNYTAPSSCVVCN